MYQIELFQGYVVITPLLFVIDIILILHFVTSYFFGCYLQGFKVDFWHSTIFLYVFIPVLLMYPFTASVYQSQSVGTMIYRLKQYVDYAFLISVAGYIASYAAYYYFNLTKSNSLLYFLLNKVNTGLSLEIYRTIKSSINLMLHVLIICLGISVLVFMLRDQINLGSLVFRLRDYTLTNPQIRPLVNLILGSYTPLILTFVGVRLLSFREPWCVVAFGLLFLFTFTGGSRYALLMPILTIVVCLAIANKKRTSIVGISAIGFILVFVAFLLADIRQSEIGFSIAVSSKYFVSSLIYGNSFAELRDFAWILSLWDGVLGLGRTYLAAFVSFLPRFVSTYRQDNSISIYTIELLGFDHSTFAGVRPVIYGEAYLNFGLIGVVFIGFITGYVLRYIDYETKKIAKYSSLQIDRLLLIKIYATMTIYNIVLVLQNTAGFWSIYVLFVILAIGWFFRKIVRIRFLKSSLA
jgi:oligosaccharide repeat unit polymerase